MDKDHPNYIYFVMKNITDVLSDQMNCGLPMFDVGTLEYNTIDEMLPRG